MREQMCKLWTNFAKYQDPTPDHCNPISTKWKPVQQIASDTKEIDLDYLGINEESKMIRNVNKHRVDFWRDIYKTWNTSFVTAKL